MSRLAPLLLILVLVGCRYKTKQEANDACIKWAETTRSIRPQSKDIDEQYYALEDKYFNVSKSDKGVTVDLKEGFKLEDFEKEVEQLEAKRDKEDKGKLMLFAGCSPDEDKKEYIGYTEEMRQKGIMGNGELVRSNQKVVKHFRYEKDY
ncbi:hypothetical protein [Synechococcus sp. UW179A]|uniref:hypothetical protein n=1 Tax=Synechococcus sp. UW179A TaxID=2575510 RepID=UPI000E0E7A56|nr:hypothetical protein [Synechococcus sp. UW179A]